MSTPFVARENELARLDQALLDSFEGNGQILFIAGEAGAGKTALLSVFVDRALDQHPDLVIGIGTCNSHTGINDPFLPFRDILAMFTGDVERGFGSRIQSPQNETRLKDLLKVSGQAIVELGPDLLDIFVPGSGIITRAGMFLAEKAGWLKNLEAIEKKKKAASTPTPLDPSRIIEQYSNVIRSMSDKQPLLIAIDDLQWADPSSIDLFFHLARKTENSSVFLIGTYRPEEIALGRAGSSHPLTRVLGDLKRYYGNIVLNLDGSEQERRDFVWALIDSQPNKLNDRFRQDLFHHTSGHALFTVELLEEIKERGDIILDENGLWYQPKDITWDNLPSQIEGIIETRLDRLEPSDQEVLRIGCVEGEVFTGEAVARVLNINSGDLIRELSTIHVRKHDLITAEGIERINSTRISHYRFRHVLFQKYLYSMLDEAERSYLHEDLGTALEELYGQHAPEIAVQLARHFSLSGNHGKAIDYLLKSGNRAHAASAYREAVDAFSQGLKILKELPDGEERNLKGLMLHLALGNTLLATKGPADKQVQENFNQAVEISKIVEDGHQSFMAIRGLSYHKKMRGEYQASKAFEKQMLSMAENLKNPVLLLEAHRLAAESLTRPAKFEDASREYEIAASYYDPAEHRKYVALYGYDPGIIVQSQLSYFTWSLGYPDRAITIGEESLKLARELDHPLSSAAALDTISALYHQLRDPVRCGEIAQTCIDLSSEYGFLMWEARASMRRGWSLAITGQESEGIQLIDSGLDTFKKLGMRISIPCMWALKGEAQLIAGALEACLSTTEEAIEVIEGSNERYCEVEIHRIRGDCLAQQGNSAQAESSYRQAVMAAVMQNAKSLELRARLSLVKLLLENDQHQEELHNLDRLYSWFKEGFNTSDLQETKALLEEHL